MSRNLLIIGSSGCIGTHLVEALQTGKYDELFNDIVLCDPQTPENLYDRFHYIGDRVESLKESRLSKILGEFGGIINVSGINNETGFTRMIHDLSKIESLVSKLSRAPGIRWVDLTLAPKIDSLLGDYNQWKQTLITRLNTGHISISPWFSYPVISPHASTQSFGAIVPRVINAVQYGNNFITASHEEITNDNWVDPERLADNLLRSLEQKSRNIRYEMNINNHTTISHYAGWRTLHLIKQILQELHFDESFFVLSPHDDQIEIRRNPEELFVELPIKKAIERLTNESNSE